MKTIKDAVIEFNGIWPEQAKDSRWFVVLSKKLDGSHSELKLDRDQFEACANRLGYINGYRWGVEYPTNGKRPELSDDVLVELRYSEGGILFDKAVGDSRWLAGGVVSFRITDPRYKPVDTSYLDASTQDQSLTHSEEGLTHNWHERGELPPVGFECLCQAKKDVGRSSFCKVKIVGYGKTTVAMESLQNIINAKAGDLFVESFDDLEFRPIRTEREKVIEAAKIATGAEPLSTSNYIILDCLYKAGMLVLPPKKSDTKD